MNETPAQKTAALHQALADAVTTTDITEIAAALIVKAKEGNMSATRLLFSYVLGKPTASANSEGQNPKKPTVSATPPTSAPDRNDIAPAIPPLDADVEKIVQQQGRAAAPDEIAGAKRTAQAILKEAAEMQEAQYQEAGEMLTLLGFYGEEKAKKARLRLDRDALPPLDPLCLPPRNVSLTAQLKNQLLQAG